MAEDDAMKERDQQRATPQDDVPDFYALLTEFEKLVLDANDSQLPRPAQLPISKRLNEVRAKLQVLGARSESKERSELEKKIAGFSILPDGWDSYGAKAFTPRTIVLAMEMARKLGDDWKAVPCGDGTIEFYRGDENEILWVQTNE